MKVGGYDIDIVVQGYPGRSVCHGGLGWSSIVLLRGHGRVGLVDVGAFGMRKMLIERLEQRGLKPRDVTDVLLTHSHWDHAVNWTLFSKSRIVIGAHELDWSLKEPWGETPVAELYMKELERWPTLHAARDGEEVFPNVTVHVKPGHTPGSLVYFLEGQEYGVVFTGDAAKNRAELLSRAADLSYDQKLSSASIEGIWEMWRRRPGTILVPGHDVPMVLEDGEPRYIDKREAGVRAWFDTTLEKTTVFQLTLA
jgi:N-acyl homoserine lactone hydrolase